MNVTIRDADAADIPVITDIYGFQVLHGLATFEEVPPDAGEMLTRFHTTTGNGFPYIVAELDGEVVGYAYAGPYRPRVAYRFSVEDSVYVRDGVHGRGIGRRLLESLIERCEAGPWQQMIAVIGNSGNTASIVLHQKLGFRHVGTIERVGFKLGQWVDTVIMQRSLSEDHS